MKPSFIAVQCSLIREEKNVIKHTNLKTALFNTTEQLLYYKSSKFMDIKVASIEGWVKIIEMAEARIKK